MECPREKEIALFYLGLYHTFSHTNKVINRLITPGMDTVWKGVVGAYSG